MLQIQALSKSQILRRKAETCERLADCAQSPADRERLLRMREASLTRASNEEWLGGLPPVPPVNAGALRRPRRG